MGVCAAVKQSKKPNSNLSKQEQTKQLPNDPVSIHITQAGNENEHRINQNQNSHLKQPPTTEEQATHRQSIKVQEQRKNVQLKSSDIKVPSIKVLEQSQNNNKSDCLSDVDSSQSPVKRQQRYDFSNGMHRTYSDNATKDLKVEEDLQFSTHKLPEINTDEICTQHESKKHKNLNEMLSIYPVTMTKGHSQRDQSLICATLTFQEPIQLEKVKLQNGTEYEGEWLKGQKYGEGWQKWPDGSQYIGSFINNNEEGKGVLKYKNGEIYEGQFKEGKAEGWGKRKFKILQGQLKTEVQYEGEWKQDLQHGSGKEAWSNGTKYEGQFKNGVKSGRGTMVFTDGSCYQGQFNGNQMHGKGIYVWKPIATSSHHKQNLTLKLVEKRYEGAFQNGKFHGFGKLVTKMIRPCSRNQKQFENIQNIYQGQFRDDLMHGNGVYKWYNGTSFKGKWINGKMGTVGQFIDYKGYRVSAKLHNDKKTRVRNTKGV